MRQRSVTLAAGVMNQSSPVRVIDRTISLGYPAHVLGEVQAGEHAVLCKRGTEHPSNVGEDNVIVLNQLREESAVYACTAAVDPSELGCQRQELPQQVREAFLVLVAEVEDTRGQKQVVKLRARARGGGWGGGGVGSVSSIIAS